MRFTQRIRMTFIEVCLNVNSTVFNARFFMIHRIHFSSSYSLSSKFLLRSLCDISLKFIHLTISHKGSSLICIHYTHFLRAIFNFSFFRVPARIIILDFFLRNHYGFLCSCTLIARNFLVLFHFLLL